MLDEQNCYLVSFDTDRIKEYVFATDKLREVRGASLLLTELNKSSTMKNTILSICPDYEEVFFAGGSGAVLVPSQEKTKEIIVAVEELYRNETFTASITGACIPLFPATRTKDFGHRMEVAGLKLREAKDEKARRTLATIEPYTQPCAACERYPAVGVSPIDQTAICEACNAKRRKFHEYRESQGSKAPEDLTILGKVAHPPGYIGFIYADGNSMGEKRKQLRTVKQYQDFANDLNKLITDTVDNALEKHPLRRYKKGEDGEVCPHEKLLVGGDDLILVTAGDIALSVAMDIAENFERGSHAVLKKADLHHDGPLTLGVGLVFAHAGFPIAAFRQLAEQLCKRAKRRCSQVKYETSAIDFMVVNAAGSSDLKTIRDEILTQEIFAYPHGDRHVRLTQRPYTLPEAKELLKHLQNFKRDSFPRSQLQFLYEGLFHSYYEAFFRWCKVAGRATKERRELMRDFHQKFGNGLNGVPPWRTNIIQFGKNAGEREYTSALGDLIEIYQFVQPSGKENPNAVSND